MEYIIEQVKQSLECFFKKNKTNNSSILAAGVSGGADSMVMLDVLHELSYQLKYKLIVITINHNIRSYNETYGDVECVVRKCKSYSDVICEVSEIPEGEVAFYAQKRGKGIEEAARFLRYKLFDEFVSKNNALAICIAHNRNDQLETVLQRFLQGASGSAATGISSIRGVYWRPLLNVSREDIEQYARDKKIEYRNDATNRDTKYLRNRIRNLLIPQLNNLLPGWDKSVLNGAEKREYEVDIIENLASNIKWTLKENSVVLSENQFNSIPVALKISTLYQGLKILKVEDRIPYRILKKFIDTYQCVNSCNICFSKKNKLIYIDRIVDNIESKGFFYYFDSPGEYELPFGTIYINQFITDKLLEKKLYFAENVDRGYTSGLFTLPIVVRNYNNSDVIRTADNKMKLVKKVFSENRIEQNIRYNIPLFVDSEIRGIWGDLYGFKNWFVEIKNAEKREF